MPTITWPEDKIGVYKVLQAWAILNDCSVEEAAVGVIHDALWSACDGIDIWDDKAKELMGKPESESTETKAA